jgi:excisionase family DNA binding protein
MAAGLKKARGTTRPAASRRRLDPQKRPLRSGQRVGELCTASFAARHLKLHVKTVLRFIREGRLRATRVGRGYRIVRSDLETFAGVSADAHAFVDDTSVTSIVDIPRVEQLLAQKWARTVTAALNAPRAGGRPLRADVIYDTDRSFLKIIIVGGPDDTVKLLGLIQVWLAQLRA